MQQTETEKERGPSVVDAVADDSTAVQSALLLELTQEDGSALVVGRRNAVTMLKDILAASEDMNS